MARLISVGTPLGREALDGMPRLGWVEHPTPVTELSEIADRLGLAWMGVKRDDLCAELHGGTKVRKLDFVLAAPLLASAPEWISVGAIGSGHLATLTAAAEVLDRRLAAVCFWEPLGDWVLENLAFTASGPTTVRFHGSRVGVALRNPGALLSQRSGGLPVVAPGASDQHGVLGIVRAGLELAEQVRQGELPPPDRVYVPFGSGGTVAGLSLGFALGGLSTRIVAVATVERVFATAGRVRSLVRAACDALAAAGIEVPKGIGATPVEIDRTALGRGYGRATADSLRECASFRSSELPLEPIYSGKAMAALRARAPKAERILFWLTPHRGGLPRADDWRERLPAALESRLNHPGRVGRRRMILVGGAAAAGLAFGVRACGHGSIEGWRGEVLSEWEGTVIAAAVAVLVPERPGGPLPPGPSPEEAAIAVDRFVLGMSARARTELHGMFVLLEHGTLIGGELLRLTRLDPEPRFAYLAGLMRRSDDVGHAARGLRDLCYLGFYQDSRAWGPLGYGGPLVGPEPRGLGRYDALVAPPGAPPSGAAP